MNFGKRFDLKGKYALITGAGGLLGYEHASALLEINSNVILTDISNDILVINKNKLIKQFPSLNKGQILCYSMDVTSIKSIQEVCDNLKSHEIFIDILINNAAVDHKVGENKSIEITNEFEEFSLEKWNKEISVGLTGAFQCAKVFGKSMIKANRSGVVLNIASDLSVIAPDQRIYKVESKSNDKQFFKPVTYSVIKTGLVGLTRYLSTYWADKNIRTNALSPGGVFNNQNQEFVTKLTNLIPMNRMANIDEYRGAIQFLCSDASSYLNGQNIVIDGGRSVW